MTIEHYRGGMKKFGNHLSSQEDEIHGCVNKDWSFWLGCLSEFSCSQWEYGTYNEE